MMERLTALELLLAALAVLGVLELMARVASRARAKEMTATMPVVSAPKPVAEIQPAAPTPVVTAPAAIVAAPPVSAPVSLTLDPPVPAPPEPIAVASTPPTPPAPIAVASEPLVPIAASPITVKARVTGAARSKRRVRVAKVKVKRRAKKSETVTPEQRATRPAFAAVTKAKPALTRRPKRAIQRRKKTPMPPGLRAGRGAIEASPAAL